MKQQIGNFGFSVMLIGFLFGSSIILPSATQAKQDSWIAVFLGGSIGTLFFILYFSLFQLYPNLSFFKYTKIILGKYLGTIINMFYLGFFVHLAALVLRNFWSFMATTFYSDTSELILAITIMLVIVFAVFHGIEVISRTLSLIIPTIPLIFLMLYLLLWKEYNFQYLLPIGENGIKPIIEGAFSILTFPFGELVAFTVLLPFLGQTNKTKKILVSTVFFTAIFGTITIILNTATLGILREEYNFPIYEVVKLIEVLDFVERIDAFIMLVWIFSIFAKLSLLFYVVTLGTAEIFQYEDHRPFIIPMSIIITSLSFLVYDNIVEMTIFALNTWPFYAIIFEFIIPFILLLIALMKNKSPIN